MRKKYFYDLHCHTSASIDSPAKIKEIVKLAKRRGLDGIAITDHNKRYSGAESIDGLQIIPGNEITLNDGSHLLSYFTTKDVPRNFNLEKTVSSIKKQGGYAVLAHPLRMEHGYLKNRNDQERRKALSLVDGIEAANAADYPKLKDSALELKKKHPDIDFFFTAGSDAQMSGQIGFAAVAVDKRLNKDNFREVLSRSEILIRPESKEFRDRVLYFRYAFPRFIKFARSLNLVISRKIFHIVFSKNFFRLNNIRFSRVKFNFREEKKKELD